MIYVHICRNSNWAWVCLINVFFKSSNRNRSLFNKSMRVHFCMPRATYLAHPSYEAQYVFCANRIKSERVRAVRPTIRSLDPFWYKSSLRRARICIIWNLPRQGVLSQHMCICIQRLCILCISVALPHMANYGVITIAHIILSIAHL